MRRKNRIRRREVLRNIGIGTIVAASTTPAIYSAEKGKEGKDKIQGRKPKDRINDLEENSPNPQKMGLDRFDPYDIYEVRSASKNIVDSGNEEEIGEKLTEKQKRAVIDGHKVMDLTVISGTLPKKDDKNERYSPNEPISENMEATNANILSSSSHRINNEVMEKWGWEDEL